MKKYLSSLLFVLFVLGCGESNDGELTSGPVISLSKESLTLEIGKTERLLAGFMPENTPNKGHVWNSSTPGVATVDETGVVTAVSQGEATIVVTALDGKKTATCKVTVVSKMIHVTGVSLDQTKVTAAVGKKIKLTATIQPENATDKKILWNSSNNQVATVDGLGNVMAVGAGNASISATTNSGGKIASCEISVVEKGVLVPDPQISNIAKNTAYITGTFGSFDVVIEEAGLCYATSALPTIADNKVVLSGNEVKYTLNNLQQLTQYYVRFYAKAKGEIIYGNQVAFTTLGDVKVHLEVSGIYADKINLSSPVTDGVKTISLCYGTSPHPEVTDHITAPKSSSTNTVLFWELADLKRGTTYYVRAFRRIGSNIEYLDDEIKVETMGGSQFSFTEKLDKKEKYSYVNVVNITAWRGTWTIDYNLKLPGTFSVTVRSYGWSESGSGSYYLNTVKEHGYIKAGSGSFSFKLESLWEYHKYSWEVDIMNIETQTHYYIGPSYFDTSNWRQ